MRRIFALLLVTPLLANCSESTTPVAPSGHGRTLVESPADDAATVATLDAGWAESQDDNWTLDEWLAQPLGDMQVQSAPGAGAVMFFGDPKVGTDFPPGVHDESYHGRDRVIPGTVVVNVGDKVTFRVFPGHRVAIYKPGTRPEDLVVGPGPFVLDPTNRLALQAAPVPQLSIAIHKPGRYLVICAVTRHFVDANMYGWVIVR
ncbi:MAG TPA: hypothetical protein VFJ16_22615 [Longimicrobium sp.]|nr:hypothetical protein [Longimicrobium sp.]